MRLHQGFVNQSFWQDKYQCFVQRVQNVKLKFLRKNSNFLQNFTHQPQINSLFKMFPGLFAISFRPSKNHTKTSLCPGDEDKRLIFSTAYTTWLSAPWCVPRRWQPPPSRPPSQRTDQHGSSPTVLLPLSLATSLCPWLWVVCRRHCRGVSHPLPGVPDNTSMPPPICPHLRQR